MNEELQTQILSLKAKVFDVLIMEQNLAQQKNALLKQLEDLIGKANKATQINAELTEKPISN